jgi:hypothetical protein
MPQTTLPIRNLGASGVITDLNPYNLPITGFTKGVNVRFDEGKVSRSPVFRSVKDSLGFDPRGAFGNIPSTGFDTVIMVSDVFGIYEYAAGTLTNISGSITGTTDPRPFTLSSLADVNYINRPDRVPVYRDPLGTNFADLPNWPSNHRCNALRPFGDFLIALNTTEGTATFPNRVRFSNLVDANSVPDSWDETDLTKSAGFNDLVQMQTPIVDGLELGTNFVIYSSSEAILMEFVAGTFIFNFRKLFGDEGIINQNCVVEVDGKHFVFGNNEIYVTDGTSRQSISDERVRQFVYTGMNKKNADRFFVQHNEALSEIYFCYQSGDSLVNFPDTVRCNRAAVYNYRNNSWSFMDLPNVSAGATANVNTVSTYANATGTYALIGGSYYDQEDSFNRHTLMVGNQDTANGIASSKLWALDLADEGSVAFNIDSTATKEPSLERVGIDLDEIKQPLDGYKVITRMLPQISTQNTQNTTVSFEFGASDIPNQNPNYTASASFDISTDYKIDSRAAGRYLSYKMTVSAGDYKDFQFSGFDLDVTTTGKV